MYIKPKCLIIMQYPLKQQGHLLMFPGTIISVFKGFFFQIDSGYFKIVICAFCISETHCFLCLPQKLHC